MPTRRNFLGGLAGLTAAVVTRSTPRLFADIMNQSATTKTIEITETLGALQRDEGAAPLEKGQWYTAEKVGDGLSFSFPAGSLSDFAFITTDILVEGFYLTVFQLELQEGKNGPRFIFDFAALAEAQARLRMPLEAVNQNRWLFEREGALIKPMANGDRVDLQRVDRMQIRIHRKVEGPIRFCLTPLVATAQEPPLVSDPLLPKGPLIDELGQSALRDWPGKTKSIAEVTDRLKSQLAAADDQKWPQSFSRFGGHASTTLAPATGFFRTHHDGKRWWLIDPEGHPFWSSGADCFSPDPSCKFTGLEKALAWLPEKKGEFAPAFSSQHGEQVNYLISNFIRAFGDQTKWYPAWCKIALSHMRSIGFNTVGNWSDWKFASAAGFPYVRPLQFKASHAPNVYRDFPDVFHADIAKDMETYAQQLKETAPDPAMIGYFLMNEPTWGFSKESPAAGMLFNTQTCACRDALADHLRKRYADDAALASAWKMPVGYAQITSGRWHGTLSAPAIADLKSFSTVMVDRLFTLMTDACKKIDPNHLNLGARYFTVPPDWALAGMKRFDVFSFNCYEEHVPGESLDKIVRTINRPVMVGEWHFGALDAGLPASGIGRVKDQAARGQAYRLYVEQAAALANCVGVHYFILYDQPALGRFDGECYNIGFLDICNRPYDPLATAARQTHERLYSVVSGEVQPYADAPEYLPKLFI